ncbi:MAG: tyrosine--tRNA ligase [Phycisphaerae bacterium]|nr:tyrosine--tRNA ligase [Phycisphaerae bacterium]|tara:strand:- start:2312 stop:3628 length:1317 start_codon:yes stop_codon:yes gene_type:complete
MTTKGYLEELEWRGLVHQTTAEDELSAFLASGQRVGYCGFDPTNDSLTIGNLMPIMLLGHLQRHGHQPIVLMGGGTGLIGDPSGKDAERTLQTREQVESNVKSCSRIFERVLDFDSSNSNAAVMVNNVDWLEKLGFLEVLRDVGKHFSVNAMIQKDSVRDRLENREQGISYTEFSYMLLQAYDFLHLRRSHDCTLQIAGSDQYGNIVCGIDLIRRDMIDQSEDEPRGYGITGPLVTKADGTKFGKSESGAVWLTAERTSPYAFYQFWLNASDEDAGKYLRFFTFLDRDAIEDVEARHTEKPHERLAQRVLAEEVTRMIHGQDELDRAQAAAGALFGGDISGLDEVQLKDVFADVPHSSHSKDSLGQGMLLVDLLPETSLAGSKREAREFLKNGSISINGQKLDGGSALEHQLSADDLLYGRSILLRRGKKAWHATEWT